MGLRIVLRNLARRRRRSMLIVGIIAFATGLLFFANSAFSSTETGMRVSFVSSLTGDIAIHGPSEEKFGIFGVEMPILKDFFILPPLPDYPRLAETVMSVPGVSAMSPVVSGVSVMQVRGKTFPVAVFGIRAASYLEVCDGIRMVRGELPKDDKPGALLNSSLVSMVEGRIKRKIRANEPITLTVFEGGGFNSRKVSFSGEFEYRASNEMFNRVILVDPTTARSLNNYTLGFGTGSSGGASLDDAIPGSGGVDDLFGGGAVVVDGGDGNMDADYVNELFKDAGAEGKLVLTDDSAWNYLLVRIDPSADAAEVRGNIETALRMGGFDVVVQGWREAAGLTAQTALLLKIIFLFCLVFVSVGAMLIIMNSLAVAVMERMGEIGTMRAIGASNGFIRRMFIYESCILSVAGSTLGIFVGWLAVGIVSNSSIPLANTQLVMLFGSRTLSMQASADGVLLVGLASLSIAALAWIYPVQIALGVSPITAIQKT